MKQIVNIRKHILLCKKKTYIFIAQFLIFNFYVFSIYWYTFFQSINSRVETVDLELLNFILRSSQRKLTF